jgi:hypothetical protein
LKNKKAILGARGSNGFDVGNGLKRKTNRHGPDKNLSAKDLAVGPLHFL